MSSEGEGEPSSHDGPAIVPPRSVLNVGDVERRNADTERARYPSLERGSSSISLHALAAETTRERADSSRLGSQTKYLAWPNWQLRAVQRLNVICCVRYISLKRSAANSRKFLYKKLSFRAEDIATPMIPRLTE